MILNSVISSPPHNCLTTLPVGCHYSTDSLSKVRTEIEPHLNRITVDIHHCTPSDSVQMTSRITVDDILILCVLGCWVVLCCFVVWCVVLKGISGRLVDIIPDQGSYSGQLSGYCGKWD